MKAKMKPILFNTDMVRAILDGRKTVTRRSVKPQHLRVLNSQFHREHPEVPDYVLLKKLCKPPYQPGDILYVRETWDTELVTPGGHFRPNGVLYYKADGDLRPDAWRGPWHPSIHMPREASRIFLRVTDVRVERLQDITDDEAEKEGFDDYTSTALGFPFTWNSTIKPKDRDQYGWEANPWVWVISFKRISKEEAIDHA